MTFPDRRGEIGWGPYTPRHDRLGPRDDRVVDPQHNDGAGGGAVFSAVAQQALAGVTRPFKPKEEPAAYLGELLLKIMEALHARPVVAKLVVLQLSSNPILEPLLAERLLLALAAHASQMVDVAGRQDDSFYQLVAHRYLGTVKLLTGQNRAALETFQLGERYRDPSRLGRLSTQFGYQDPKQAILCWKIFALILVGLLDQAARLREQVRAECASHIHAQAVAAETFAVVWPAFLIGELAANERLSAELVEFCSEKRVEQFRLLATILHACARARREPSTENIATLRSAIEAENHSGARVADSVWLSQLVEVSLAAGDVVGAEAALKEAFAFVEQSGERFWLAELHRLDGHIALERTEPERSRAEACFIKAIEIASSQEARLIELRAATDLARVWRDTGSPNDTRALLEPILAAIEGGETTKDVRNARALLAEIGRLE